MVYSVAYNMLGEPRGRGRRGAGGVSALLPLAASVSRRGVVLDLALPPGVDAAVDAQRQRAAPPEPVDLPRLAGGTRPAAAGVDAPPRSARPGRSARATTAHLRCCATSTASPYQEIAEITGRPLGTVKVDGASAARAPRLRLRLAAAEDGGGLMDCSDVHALINRYIDGELGVCRGRRVPGHLDSAGLRRRAARARRGARRRWPRGPAAPLPPAGFAERVMAVVAPEPLPGSPRPLASVVEDALDRLDRRSADRASRRPHDARQEPHRLGVAVAAVIIGLAGVAARRSEVRSRERQSDDDSAERGTTEPVS